MSGSAAAYRHLDRIGRIRLSESFYLRDFLMSEIAAAYGLSNFPDDLDLAVETGKRLCEQILEPLQATFGRIHIRSGYRSSSLNAFGAANRLNCASNEKNYAHHIWDRRDAAGNAGACACIVIPWFERRYQQADWPLMAAFLDRHLDYHRIVFFSRQTAFNIGWRDNPQRQISSYAAPAGLWRPPERVDERLEVFPAFAGVGGG